MVHPPPPPSPSAASAPANRLFTFKSVAAGLIGSLGIAVGATHIDDMIGKYSYVTGNFTPPGVIAYVLFLVLGWNPFFLGLLGRVFRLSWARRFGFGTRELVLVFALTYTSCWIPASGLYRYFHPQIAVAWVHTTTTHPHWEPALQTLPEKLFPYGLRGRHPDATLEERQAWERAYQLLPSGDPVLRQAGWRGVGQWPWRDWIGAMRYWWPLLAAFAVATVSLAMVVHRQWWRHEQIPFPLGQMYAALLEREDRHVLPPMMRSRLFWGAFIGVFLLYAWNWAALWFPNLFPSITMGWWIHTWHIFPELHRAGPLWNHGKIIFAIIGVTYLISTEAAFTLGASQFLTLLVVYPIYKASGQPVSDHEYHGVRMGGYFAYMLLLLYAGRHWYARLLAKALGWGRPNPDDADSVWAARIFLAAYFATWLILCWMEMDPVLALFWQTFLFGSFLVFSRLLAEAGMPFMQMAEINIPFMHLLGYRALGVRGAMYMGHLQMVLAQNHREALAPYTMHALYVGARANAPQRKLVLAIIGALLLALVVGWWTKGHSRYVHGTAIDPHGHMGMSGHSVERALDALRLVRQDLIPAIEPVGLSRLAAIRPEPGTLGPVLAGVAITFAIAAMRYRYSWFFLHPLLCLVVGAGHYSMWVTAQCFLIGWAIKSLVLHYGGGRVYMKGKPFFVGLFAGEAAMIAVSLVVGVVYYLLTDGRPPTLDVHPT